MQLTIWGTRGSIASPGPETTRYGGNTSCVEVRASPEHLIVLDAGTGIRRLARAVTPRTRRVDLLLTHLHMDHIQGLGFFGPLFDPEVTTHLWAPASSDENLRLSLSRYLSPPLFPVHLRDLPRLTCHAVTNASFELGEFGIACALVNHPNPTVGFRVTRDRKSLTYLPDHEPALGLTGGFLSGEWTSGFSLAEGADILVHDAQYTDDEYRGAVGWGHSTMRQAVAFARLAGVRTLVPFHHDPAHSDDDLDRLFGELASESALPFKLTPGKEGDSFTL